MKQRPFIHIQGPLTWLRVEYCVLTRKGSFFALSWLTAYLGTYLLVTLQVCVCCVFVEYGLFLLFY